MHAARLPHATPDPAAPRIRRARPTDLAALARMHERSMRELGRGHYRPEVIEGFLRHFGTIDATMIEDGYFVAEAAGRIVASGGWSEREPGYVSALLAHRSRAPRARIRAVFVDPAHARKGLGRAMVERAEREARARGHGEIALDATLTGVPLYAALGYRSEFATHARLPDGGAFVVVHMRKRFPTVP